MCPIRCFLSNRLYGQTNFVGYAWLYQPLLGQVFQEANAKMGLNEIY